MTFDIDARIQQWDTANKAQFHTEGFQRTMVPLPEEQMAKNVAMRLKQDEAHEMFNEFLAAMTGRQVSRDEFENIISWISDSLDKQDPEFNMKGAVAAATAAKDQVPITGEPTGLDEYVQHLDDAKNSKAPMNRIGADKPRSIFIGEGGYDEFTAGPEDQTEIRGRDLYGLPENYGGLSARAEMGKEMSNIDQAIADRQPTGRMGPEPVRPRDGGQHR